MEGNAVKLGDEPKDMDLGRAVVELAVVGGAFDAVGMCAGSLDDAWVGSFAAGWVGLGRSMISSMVSVRPAARSLSIPVADEASPGSVRMLINSRHQSDARRFPRFARSESRSAAVLAPTLGEDVVRGLP